MLNDNYPEKFTKMRHLIILFLLPLSSSFNFAPSIHNLPPKVNIFSKRTFKPVQRTPAMPRRLRIALNSEVVESSESISTIPQSFTTAMSMNPSLPEALNEAVLQAISDLPDDIPSDEIALCVVTVSSIYDATSSMSIVVPTLTSEARGKGLLIKNVVGSTAGGVIGCEVRLDEERSDELTTPPQAAKITLARTSVQDTPPL